MKVVFDSNVYVSVLLLPGGTADAAIRAATQASVEIFISRPILEEVLGVMARKFAREPEELSRTALYLGSLAEIVAPRRRIDVLADPPDNRILECALAAGAEIIVAGDRQMLALGTWEGIEILSLRQFVDRLDSARALHESRTGYRVLESEHVHLALLREAVAGVQDVRDGRVRVVARSQARSL